MPYINAAKHDICRICGEPVVPGQRIGWWPKWGVKHMGEDPQGADACNGDPIPEEDYKARRSAHIESIENGEGEADEASPHLTSSAAAPTPRRRRYWFVMTRTPGFRKFRSQGRYKTKAAADKSLRHMNPECSPVRVRAYTAEDARELAPRILADRQRRKADGQKPLPAAAADAVRKHVQATFAE